MTIRRRRTRATFRYIRSMASSSSTTWSRNTSATDSATFIAGSGRPRVLRPTELQALMTRASSLPAQPESTVYLIAVTSPLAGKPGRRILDRHLQIDELARAAGGVVRSGD